MAFAITPFPFDLVLFFAGLDAEARAVVVLLFEVEVREVPDFAVFDEPRLVADEPVDFVLADAVDLVAFFVEDLAFDEAFDDLDAALLAFEADAFADPDFELDDLEATDLALDDLA